MSANVGQAKLSRRESPRPKLPKRQVLIRLAIAVIATVIAFNLPHSLISVFFDQFHKLPQVLLPRLYRQDIQDIQQQAQ